MKRSWMPRWTVPLLIAMAIGTVWLRLSIVDMTYTIDQADREIHDLQQQREQMELKVTALRSPRRMEILAKTRFALAPAKSDQIVHMRDQSGQ